MPALYLTIWTALVLFAAGETGRSLTSRGPRPPVWAWWAFTAGLLLAVVHTILSFEIVHGWSNEAAAVATARQTQAVFGISVGWGVHVNYVFFVVWLGDVLWWRMAPEEQPRTGAFTWILRAFYLLIILNAAVVFAAGPRRILGLAIVTWLATLWGRGLVRRTALKAELP